MVRNSKRRPQVKERFLTGVQTGPLQKSIFHNSQNIRHTDNHASTWSTTAHPHTQWNGKYFYYLQAKPFLWACPSRLGSPTTAETALGRRGMECCGKGTRGPSLISSFRGPASQRTNVRGGAVRDALPAFLSLPRLPASCGCLYASLPSYICIYTYLGLRVQNKLPLKTALFYTMSYFYST